MTPETALDVSIVIPCLNEEATITVCVEKALKAIANAGVDGEVVVVDNNSTDRSSELATAAGARVVFEKRPGYGSAYIAGLNAARGRTILMGDADGTYDFGELPRFLALADQGADFVLGSRLKGKIHKGAMPWHHRWIGNPSLTGMLNVLFRAGVSDAHCGLRMITRDSLPKMNLSTPGMEFASEMVIKATQAGLTIKETPIEYYARPGESASKLKAFSDGFRHVRYMLSWASPLFFWVPAIALAAVGALALTPLFRLPGDPITGAALLTAGGLVAHAGAWARAYRVLVLEPTPERHRVARWIMARSSLVTIVVALALFSIGRAVAHPHDLALISSEETIASVITSLCSIALVGVLGFAAVRRIAPAEEA